MEKEDIINFNFKISADSTGKQSGYGGQTKPVFHKKAKTVCAFSTMRSIAHHSSSLSIYPYTFQNL
jgi:hypothetical protein